jgi:hypothetical protein
VGSASTGLNEAGGKRKVGNMERDALLVDRESLEQIFAKAEAGQNVSVKELLRAILGLCPPVNRQRASAAEHLLESLEGLMENLEQDMDGGWSLHPEAEPFLNAAELALLMAYGDTGRGEIGTSVAHQLKDANAAVAISHEQIEELFALLRETQKAIKWGREVLSSSPILTDTFNRIFADVEEKVEAKLCTE